MAEIAGKVFEEVNPAAPLIHEDTSGTLPTARIAIDGEHGEPATNEGEASVLAYIPGTDDAGQWHPISDLISAAPATSITDGVFVLDATSLEIADLVDAGWQDLQEQVLGAGAGRLTVSASVPLSLDSAGNSIRTIDVRLVIDGYATASQTVTCATDSTAGNTSTATFTAVTYSVPLLAQHRIRVQVDRAAGDAAATIYTTGSTITVVADESEPLTLGGDLSGLTDAAEVVGIYGNPIDASAAAPTSGQALVWDGTNWLPTQVGSPVLYNGDMIYGSGYVDGAPGANLNVPATSTIIANSTTITGTTANTIDSNDATSWRTFNNGYVTYDLADPAPAIRGWRVRQLVSNPLFGATSIVLAGSNDNSTWTTIDTWTSAPATDSGTRTLATDAIYRYFRITGTGRTYFEIYTVELFESSTIFAEEARLPIGTAGQILMVNTTATAPEWVDNYATILRVEVRNDSGTSIPAHSIVYLYGASGQRPTVRLARADTDLTSARTLGWTVTAIDHNANGFVQNMGPLRNVNTSGYADGDPLFLSATTAGAYTNVEPSAPDHGVRIGTVVKGGSVGGGQVEVYIQNGYELNELHNVHVPSPSNGQVLTYVTANNRWEAVTPSGGGGGGASDLTDLGDVNITTPAEGDLLRYNGTTNDWENFPEGDLAVAGDVTGTLADTTVAAIQATPVSATAPTEANQAIVYDGAEYVPYRLKASDLATILTPIFTEDGLVLFDVDGVILAEVNN